LAFSIRTENCLHNHNIRFVAELTSYTETQLLKKSGFGRKVLKEIVEVLEDYGVKLEMQFDSEIQAEIDRLLQQRRSQPDL
jgi:DNA-directed RNA polymerase alpha subunit